MLCGHSSIQTLCFLGLSSRNFQGSADQFASAHGTKQYTKKGTSCNCRALSGKHQLIVSPYRYLNLVITPPVIENLPDQAQETNPGSYQDGQ